MPRRRLDEISSTSSSIISSGSHAASSYNPTTPCRQGLLVLLFLAITSLSNAQRLRGQDISISERIDRMRYQRQKAQCDANIFLEPCGRGEGLLICEYDEQHHDYSTRCVKSKAARKHVEMNRKNYCGACHKCFQNGDELRSAVAKYVENATSVAHIYGRNIGDWCVDKVQDFSYLFHRKRTFNEDISAWQVSNAINMSYMFHEAFEFNQDLSLWNTSKVQDFTAMFDRAYAFQGKGLRYWQTDSAQSFKRMFRIAKHFQEDISLWQTSHVTDMGLMFYRAEQFNSPLNFWQVDKVTDLSYTFAFARKFNQPLDNWMTSAAETMRGMFQGAESFAQDIMEWNTASVTDMAFMFQNAIAFQQSIDPEELEESWEMDQVTNKQEMLGAANSVFNQTFIEVL